MKRALILSTMGLILGGILATWIGPNFLSWWFEPPVQMAVNCTDPIRWAMQRLVIFQSVGAVLGLVGGFTLSLVFIARGRKTTAPSNL